MREAKDILKFTKLRSFLGLVVLLISDYIPKTLKFLVNTYRLEKKFTLSVLIM